VSGPFGRPGRWLRCQLHAHTTNSDGDATSRGLADHYARAGFDVLAITDHWHATSCEHPALTVIASSELSAAVPEEGVEEAEVLALGVDELTDPRQEFPDIEQCAAWIAAHGGAGFLAHPYWSGLAPHHALAAPSLSGIEVYNGGSELFNGNGLSAEFWDGVSHGGRLLPGIACDDCHYPGHDSLLAWTVVRAESAEREPVVAALRDGAFYGSSGAELHDLRVTETAVEIDCSPAEAVTLRSGPWDGGRVNADLRRMNWRGEVLARDARGLITSARLRLPERIGWGRVEVSAAGGARAWTSPQPLPLDPLEAEEGGWPPA